MTLGIHLDLFYYRLGKNDTQPLLESMLKNRIYTYIDIIFMIYFPV